MHAETARRIEPQSFRNSVEFDIRRNLWEGMIGIEIPRRARHRGEDKCVIGQ
jgi:hypothetical protein